MRNQQETEAPRAEAGAAAVDALAADLVAVLFVATSPLAIADLTRILERERAGVEAAVERLCAEPPLGLAVVRAGDTVHLASAPSSAVAVERYFGTPPPTRLSRAALEALAIIAYRQPVTRAEIEVIRGVNSDSAVATLLGRGLVMEVGRRDTAGRPALLGTTPDFLQYLGLARLEDLPPLPAATKPEGD